MEQLINYLKQPTVIIFIIVVFLVMIYNMIKVARVKKQAEQDYPPNQNNINPINQEEETKVDNKHEGRSILLTKEDHSTNNNVKVSYHEKPPKGYQTIYKVSDDTDKEEIKKDVKKDIFKSSHAVFGEIKEVIKGRFIYVSIKTIIALIGIGFLGYDLIFIQLRPIHYNIELGAFLFLCSTILYNWFYALSTIKFYERGFVQKTFFKEKSCSYNSIDSIVYERKGLFRLALERKQKILLNVTILDFLTAIIGLNFTALEEVTINTLEAGKTKKLAIRGWNYFLITETFQIVENNLIFSKQGLGYVSKSIDATEAHEQSGNKFE